MIKELPTTWDETIVLPMSYPGKVAAYARRKGDVWYLGVLCGPAGRTMTLPLSFLGEGKYSMLCYGDDSVEQKAYVITHKAVSDDSSVEVRMRDAGGFVAKISPAE